jgi:hypothetical protein
MNNVRLTLFVTPTEQSDGEGIPWEQRDQTVDAAVTAANQMTADDDANDGWNLNELFYHHVSFPPPVDTPPLLPHGLNI